MVDDLPVAEALKAADRQFRVDLPQPFHGLFHVSFPLPVPAGHIGIRLRFRQRPVQIQSHFPGRTDGFQTDIRCRVPVLFTKAYGAKKFALSNF